MKIGIEADRANKREKTGTEWYAYHLIEHLKKIVTQDEFFLYSRETLHDDLKTLPLHFTSIVLPWKGKLWSQIRLAFHLLFHKVDVLFIPAHTIPFMCVCPVITTLHDVGFKRNPSLYPFLERLYHDLSTRYALKKASQIITVSEFSKQEICTLYNVKNEKIHVIYNGYDENIYKVINDKEKIQNVLKYYNISYPYLLYVGRLEKKKNILTLIKSFEEIKKEFPSFSLVLIGKKGHGYEEIHEYLQKSRYKEDVRELGWVKQADLPYVYNGSSLFLFPTFYEGFGIPIIEAMACGVPVITSDYGAQKEITGNAALLVDPLNVGEISQKAKEILLDTNQAKQLIRNGLIRVKDFSYQQCAKQTYNVLCKWRRR